VISHDTTDASDQPGQQEGLKMKQNQNAGGPGLWAAMAGLFLPARIVLRSERWPERLLSRLIMAEIDVSMACYHAAVNHPKYGG